MLKQNNMYYGQLVVIKSEIGHFKDGFKNTLSKSMLCSMNSKTALEL